MINREYIGNLIKKILLLIFFVVVANCHILFAAEYEVDNGFVKAYSNNSKINGWYKDQGKDYYAEDGRLVLGLKNISGKTYFFYTSGTKFGEVAKGYVTIEYFEYYFDDQGEMVVDGTTPDGKKTDEDGIVLDEEGNVVVKDAGYSKEVTKEQMSIFVARMNQWHISESEEYVETSTQALNTIGDISSIVGEADNGVLWNGVPKYERTIAETTSNRNDAAVLAPDNANSGGVNIVGRR